MIKQTAPKSRTTTRAKDRPSSRSVLPDSPKKAGLTDPIPTDVAVMIKVDGGRVTYQQSANLTSSGEVRVKAGGKIVFSLETEGEALAVGVIPKTVQGDPIKFRVGSVPGGRPSQEIVVRIPARAADGDSYKYSVAIFANDGSVISDDPIIVVFR